MIYASVVRHDTHTAKDLMLRRAERTVESQSGALSRTLDALDSYLPPPVARRRAS